MMQLKMIKTESSNCTGCFFYIKEGINKRCGRPEAFKKCTVKGIYFKFILVLERF